VRLGRHDVANSSTRVLELANPRSGRHRFAGATDARKATKLVDFKKKKKRAYLVRPPRSPSHLIPPPNAGQSTCFADVVVEK